MYNGSGENLYEESFPQTTSRMNNLPMEYNGYGAENTTLIRNKIRTAKESSQGIEEILLEMPSRTLGRRNGSIVARAINSGTQTIPRRGRISHGTVSRIYATARKNRLQSTGVDLRPEHIEPEIAIKLYTEISNEHGEIDNEEIRGLAVSMNMKKKIREQGFRYREKEKSKKIGAYDVWKYNMGMKLKHYKEDAKRLGNSFKLWNYHLKQVEGNFGSGVLSYFTFLRGLFLLSVPSFILNFAFISIPQLLDPPARNDPNITFTGEEILTGANWLTETIMYYGYYINDYINDIPGAFYSMPLAYLLATAGYFILCLFWLVRSTASSFRESYIDSKEATSNFFSKIFCTWDFGITSESAAQLQHKTITTELKEVLAESVRGNIKRSLCEKVNLFFIRLIVWLFYFCITGGCMVGIYYISLNIPQIKQNLNGIIILPDLILPLIVSSINLILPIIINALTHFEKYKFRRHELYVAISRNFLLKIGLLAVICAFWAAPELLTERDDIINGNISCWETELGQEIYRLVIVDFFFSIIFATFCAEFLRKILSKHVEKWERAEFAIVNNAMDLIYGQTLCWIGVYFSPLLSLIVIIKYFLMFYIKKTSVIQNCRPPTNRWRAAQSRTLFNFLLLFSFLLTTSFICVVIFRISPSADCGPFRGLDRSYDIVVTMVADIAAHPASEWFAIVLNILVNVWTVYSLIVALIVAVAIKRSTTKGYKNLSNTLRAQIASEGRDKALLLSWLQGVSGNTDDQSGWSNQNDNQHTVPILHRHRDSISSSRAGSIGPRWGSERDVSRSTLTTADVITHVDPQHLAMNQLGKMNSDISSSHSYKEHQDPILRRALANRNSSRFSNRPGSSRDYSKSVQNSPEKSHHPRTQAIQSSSRPSSYFGGQTYYDGENEYYDGGDYVP